MTTPTTHHAPRRKKQPAFKSEAAKYIAPVSSDSSASSAAPFIQSEQRHAMISDAAYFMAERREFCPGHELDDWLAAEREIDHALGRDQPEPRVRHMSDAQIPGGAASFGERLRERARSLRSEIHDTLTRIDAEQFAQIAGEVRDAEEDAVADLLVDVNMAEITRDVEELRDIEGALGRIATGTYGMCVSCAESIAPERLTAYPTAKRCLPCQRRHDQSRGITPPPSL